MVRNHKRRVERLEQHRRILRRGSGVRVCLPGESVEACAARLPPGQYLIIDEPTEDDYQLARGIAP